MLSFNGFLQRNRMIEIVRRILSSEDDDPERIREDSRALKRIVNFNAYCGCLILDACSHSVLARLHDQPIASSVVRTKGAVKDFIVQSLSNTTSRVVSNTTSRVEELVSRYRSYPQDFYQETPINGRIYHPVGEDTRLWGISRVKRFRRIAEKASRYLIEFMYQSVKEKADALVNDRASGLVVGGHLKP